MKYIIIQDDIGNFHPVTFSEEMVHLQVGLLSIAMGKQAKVVGAGFVKQNKDQNWEVYGHSDSLQIGPSPIDGYIMNAFLLQNLSGLQLMNYLQCLEIQRSNKIN